MGGAQGGIGQAAAGADDHDLVVHIAQIIAHLLIGMHAQERVDEDRHGQQTPGVPWRYTGSPRSAR